MDLDVNGELVDITDSDVVKVITMKVEQQVGRSSEEKLLFAIFRVAAYDLLSNREDIRRPAVNYMREPMHNLELMGINSDWVRDVFRTAGMGHLF